MKYTKDQRLDIGRRIYEGEISRFEAAAEYGIGSNTAREYMRLYRAEHHLPVRHVESNAEKIKEPPRPPVCLEDYHANSWLMRMGFGGADYKETRRILMGHLTGFAAFKSAADMEAHKERQAQRRRERREEAQG